MSPSKNDHEGQLTEDNFVAAPPDGGYGWVITLLALINWFFILGINFAIGTLMDDLVQVSRLQAF